MKAAAAALVALAILVTVRTSSGQVYPSPTPGSGVVRVTGKVDIGKVDVGNVVAVDAAQRGEWRVAVANSPSVATVPLSFLKASARYAVTWSDGSQETVLVLQLGGGGWARVEHDSRRRWVNLDSARAIDELP